MSARSVWISGDLRNPDSAIAPDDLALRGLSIFTTLLAIDNKPVWLEDHIARLLRHAAELSPALADSAAARMQSLRGGLADLLHANALTQGRARLRIMITPGENAAPRIPDDPDATLIAAAAPVPENPPVVEAVFSTTVRRPDPRFDVYARVKSAYANSALALEEARQRGASEALIPDHTGAFVACAATANILIRESGGVWTSPPESDGALDGITLAKLSTALDIRRESLTPQRLLDAEAVYLTNSVQGARQVMRLENRTFSPKPLEIGNIFAIP